MYDVFTENKAGSTKTSEPRPVGDILSEMLLSDSPLAQGYRQRCATEAEAEEGEWL